MLNNVCYSNRKDVVEVELMKLKELYPEVITEDTEYEYKATINPDKPIKWAKTLVGYANDRGGIMFIGVANDGEAFGLELDEIDRIKNLIAQINDRHIFPHVKLRYMILREIQKPDGVKLKPVVGKKSEHIPKKQ